MSALMDLRDHARTMARKEPADARLWTQIADEIDGYLQPAEPARVPADPLTAAYRAVAEDLFGEPTTEPDPTPEVPC